MTVTERETDERGRSTRPPHPPGVIEWMRTNLFGSTKDTILTIVFGTISILLIYLLYRTIFVTGQWDVIRANLRLFLFGQTYPKDQIWRIGGAYVSLGFLAGVTGGCIRTQQEFAGTADPRPFLSRLGTWFVRLWPIIFMGVLLLLMSETAGPWIFAACFVTAIFLGRGLGGLIPNRATGWTMVAVIVAAPLAYLSWIMWFGGVSWDDWGGFVLINGFLWAASLMFAFPIGILAALGRKSTLPAVRALCVGYIEFFRGIPFIGALFLGVELVGFALPQGFDPPSFLARGIVVASLFTGAYIAEIVRGGLNALPTGQHEAGRALGLSSLRITALIILPQALRNVIPALVGQSISLFKDTTLFALVAPVSDILSISEVARQQEEFRSMNLLTETFGFVAAMFWAGSYVMSRESQRLEARLGVGER